MFVNLLVANKAHIGSLSSNEIVVYNTVPGGADRKIEAGITAGYKVDGSPIDETKKNGVRIWAGPITDGNLVTAPFYVDEYGNMTANNADLTGLINEGTAQIGRNSFVPVDLKAIKSVTMDSFSDTYGVDNILGSKTYPYGTVLLPCRYDVSLGYYMSDVDGTAKQYAVSTPSYLKAGTHVTVRNGLSDGNNMWSMLGSTVAAWSSNTALQNLLSKCVLVCADPRIFSLSNQYTLGADGAYTRSTDAINAYGCYPRSTYYQYHHGVFASNGQRARFILLPPSQAL